MNRYDFTQPGGFPFDQGVMAFIQDCINTASQAARLAGPLAILSGCTVTGPNAADGVVVIDGEILPFTGGLITDKVIIVQTGTVIAYQDGTPRTTKFERLATFGDDGVTTLLWANFKRNTAEGILARLDRCEGLLRPFVGVGGMVWWKGVVADIPIGWQEVVAMQGMLPMAAKAPVDDVRPAGFDIGNTGGSETVSIAKTNLPNIRLDVPIPGAATSTSDSGTGRITLGNDGTELAGGPTLQTAALGSGTAMNILNPYAVGCWIEPIPGTF